MEPPEEDYYYDYENESTPLVDYDYGYERVSEVSLEDYPAQAVEEFEAVVDYEERERQQSNSAIESSSKPESSAEVEAIENDNKKEDKSMDESKDEKSPSSSKSPSKQQSPDKKEENNVKGDSSKNDNNKNENDKNSNKGSSQGTSIGVDTDQGSNNPVSVDQGPEGLTPPSLPIVMPSNILEAESYMDPTAVLQPVSNPPLAPEATGAQPIPAPTPSPSSSTLDSSESVMPLLSELSNTTTSNTSNPPEGSAFPRRTSICFAGALSTLAWMLLQ